MFKTINIIPRWVVFLIDLLICYFSFIFSYYIKNGFSIAGFDLHTESGNILVWLLVTAITFLIFRTYASIVRYTGIQDILKVSFAIVTSTAILFFISLLNTFLKATVYFSVYSLLVNFVFTTLFLVLFRLLVKALFIYLKYQKLNLKKIVIYGANDAGFLTKQLLEKDYTANVNVVAFIDDDVRRAGKIVEGVPIFNTVEFENLAFAQRIDQVIIVDFEESPRQKNKVIDFCLEHDINVLSTPPQDTWVNGHFTSRQLRNIEIENILEREPMKIKEREIATLYENKTILVTGGAGSIGGEIVKYLVKCNARKIIICDQAETPLQQLLVELAKDHATSGISVPYLADITNLSRMKELFRKHQPDFVFHAAAYKHVSLVENSITEAILTNIEGTKILADLSVEFNVKKFIFISTDKRVSPKDAVRLSKRVGEVYIQYLNSAIKERQVQAKKLEHSEADIINTKFSIARLGNVLGTSGSVSTIFKRQIQMGEPVTITHPDISRFFMTLSEAYKFVLEISLIGKGGDIYAFDMGKPVSIVSLAEKMIKLYGLVPEKDIEIKFIGLRSGENLYEEMLDESEILLATHSGKIMIVGSHYNKLDDFDKKMGDLIALAKLNSEEVYLIDKIKEMIPEFSIDGEYDN